MWHTNTKPPHTNNNNPWEAVKNAGHTAKEDAEAKETCRRPTPTKSNAPPTFTIASHVDMAFIFSGTACALANPTYHMPNIPRDKAHMYANQGASMVAQQKSLPYGKGAGM